MPATTRRTFASLVLAVVGIAGAWGWRASLVVPLHAVTTGIGRRYRIAPMKNGDDWETFVDELLLWKGHIAGSTVEISEGLYLAEKCDMDATCDIVTIDRQPAGPGFNYTFKIRNATRSHPAKQCAYACQDATGGVVGCDLTAQGEFINFVVNHHNTCDKDPEKCTASICQ